jgi:hypothetical protein
MQRQLTAPTGIASAAVISFNQLPLTISGLSELNSYPVVAPASLAVGGCVLQKRSVLVNEVIAYASPVDQNNVVELVTSTSTIVYKQNGAEIYYYNPIGVVTTLLGEGGVVGRPDPFSKINANGGAEGQDLNANYLESRQGTLFIYGSA